MTRLFLILSLLVSPDELPWQDLVLTIVEDPGYSSDMATLCRVRVVNNGNWTWSGKQIRFEAQALEGGVAVEKARGRFGLTLPPRASLETLIGFSGRYRVFAVRPLVKGSQRADSGRSGAKRSRGKAKKKTRAS